MSHKEILDLLKEVSTSSFLNPDQKELLFDLALESDQTPEKTIELIKKCLEIKSAKAIREILEAEITKR